MTGTLEHKSADVQDLYIYIHDEKSLTCMSNLVHGISMAFCVIFGHDAMYT